MRETVNTVKTPMRSKFLLTPKNNREAKYLEKLIKLLAEKRHGDWKLVEEMISLPADSVKKSFFRVYQKNHFKVVDALEQVIKNRKELIK
ncbi:hypothetical protein [Chryseobacterium sp. 2VB]|uniref:hypothetical protein n=1 Tax=Chryseobacterium sp. 2VB TaxID=2502204 RepID=UPI0010F6B0A0|nr:hypothetical protein [Chryseobacterium sp. 2VB]